MKYMTKEKAIFVLCQIAHGMKRPEKEINKAVDEIIKTIDRMNWISVKEKLPEKNGEYIVCYEDGDVSTDWYGFTDDGLIAGFDEDIVAWMFLPEPYKEDEV